MDCTPTARYGQELVKWFKKSLVGLIHKNKHTESWQYQ